MQAFGVDDALKATWKLFLRTVVPFENVLLGEGRGFEISQSRLGPVVFIIA